MKYLLILCLVVVLISCTKNEGETYSPNISCICSNLNISDNYPSFGKDRTSSALLAAAIMRIEAYPPFKEELNNNQDLKNFVLGSMLTNINSLELIWYYAKRFALN